MKQAVKLVEGLRYKLHIIFCDNEAMVCNTTLLIDFEEKKKPVITYHRACEEHKPSKYIIRIAKEDGI
jgi:hypothetical protein